MIHSMTGFGEARRDDGERAYHLELRSVNNRYLKTAIHLPEDFSFLEAEVDRLIRQRLTRGSVTFRLYVRDLQPQPSTDINTGAVRAYVRALRAATEGETGVTIDLATLLALPGVCQPGDVTEAQREHRWAVLSELANEAINALVRMRATEGEGLAADLRQHCTGMQRSLEIIRARAPLVIEEYRDRLRTRIQQLLVGSGVQLAHEDLLKEVSIYAERSDISEELSRLAGHIDQFLAQFASREPAGRKLEFIVQEMLREANTMGSKTGDVTIAREIVDLKSAIDRIKEQVQNAE